MKKAIASLAAIAVLAGCNVSDADVASRNLSQSADNFEIPRRVVFYNGINGEYILTIEGMCALDASASPKIAITCKTGAGVYKKHYLGVSDNVTYFIEQLEPVAANVNRYKVIFKPSVIIPDIVMK